MISRFPISAATSSAAPAAQARFPGEAPDRRRSAVVCDPDVVHAHLVARVLGKVGFEAAVCHDAVTCEALVAREPPALVVVALLLPDSDGLTLLRRLRTHHRDGARPWFVMLSAVQAADWAREAGADLFLAKPVPPPRLAAVVRSLVATQRSGSQEHAGSLPAQL